MGIHSKDTMSYHGNTCPSMFIDFVFTMTRKRKSHRCPQTEEWIMKNVYEYAVAYSSAMKKGEITKFAGISIGVESMT